MNTPAKTRDAQIDLIKKLAFDSKGDKGTERLDEARQLCETLLGSEPANPDLLYVMGMIVFSQGNLKAAMEWMEKAIILRPNSAEMNYNYAILLMSLRKFQTAIPIFLRVIKSNPDHAKAYYHLGNAYKEKGDLENAKEAYAKSLEIAPDAADVLNNCGNVLKEMGLLDEASVCYDKALKIEPQNPLLLNNIGVVRFLQCHLDEAEEYHLAALNLRPDYPEALSNLGMIARLNGQYLDSIECCQRALALRPAYPEALNNLGNAYKDNGEFEKAIECYDKVIALRPDYADVHNNKAMALLAIGRFSEGWQEQEWRWKSTQLRHAERYAAKPQWNGEEADGKTILIHAEQGFGDTIQFCRYASLVKAKGLKVFMEIPRPLKRILSSLDGIDGLISSGDEIPPFDYHIPMMSLPLACNTTLETIPSNVPYLHPSPMDIVKWAAKIEPLAANKRKIGLVWAGSPRSHSPDLMATDRNRSMQPSLLEPLLKTPNSLFFSLQKDGDKPPYDLIDFMDECGDFADTAALIQNLDLVITVDTAVAHLTGAIGKPVWVLNRYNSCWRWLVGRKDSPWYPTLRLFNQTKAGDWSDVIDAVCQELATCK
jgi:tetratricopeptide (TPR) repeat protein